MKLASDPEVEKFRAEFAAFLDAHLPTPAQAQPRPQSSSDVPGWASTWQRTLFDAGWLLPGNPPEYGGRNATLPQQLAHLEELSRRRIYHSFNPQGLGIIAASILTFGTQEQKQRWAIPILRAEITASLGMSEPGAGSDLASLRTRATLDGDDFVVNGQKVWTSGAHDADVLLTFVRTDTDAPKHKGISVLLIPTGTPGLVRRPFGSIASPDDIDFNEVFFTDVRVPRDNLIGELNGGWKVAHGSLGHERTLLWLSFAERLEDLVKDAPSDQEWYATLLMDLQALRLLGYRQLGSTREPAELSVLKLLGSEAVQAASLQALEEHGADGLLHPATTAPFNHMSNENFIASWFERYVRTFAGTIAGGTSEIQRNIIAERILGLPQVTQKGPSMDQILYEVSDRVAVLTLNRPEKANAQTMSLLDDLDAAWTRAASDDEVRVIVVRGNGKHFSSGHDLNSGLPIPEKITLDWLYDVETRKYLEYCLRWRNVPKPSIAAVQGKCIAGGLMLCWPCDLIVAADNAEFSDPVVYMGIGGVEYHGHTWELGPRKAKEILFTGRAITATEAEQVGMVNRVVPLAELEGATMELASQIAQMHPFALRQAKRAVNQTLDVQGFYAAIQSVFDIHQTGHGNAISHNGYPILTRLADMKDRIAKQETR